MTARLGVAWLPDGKRLHLRHGPLNSVIQAFGAPRDVGRAYDAAIARARQLLPELRQLAGRLERRIQAAIAPLPTPLPAPSATPGAIADELLEAMRNAAPLDKAFANNAGAVRLHLNEGHHFLPPAFDWPQNPRFWTRTPLEFSCVSRGICVLGWDYDDIAPGCADRVLVTAETATLAAAGAVSIARAMVLPDAQCGANRRRVDCPQLPAQAQDLLQRGQAHAEALFSAGLLRVALLSLDGAHTLVAPPAISLEMLR